MIPVLGFATLKRFDLAQRLLDSIDYPVKNLVIVDNSGTFEFEPIKPDWVANMTIFRPFEGLGLTGAWNLIVKSTPSAPYWVLINDDAWFAPGSLKLIEENVDTTALNFVDIEPRWSAPIFGEGMVSKVGLYDERFYPLYFDDNDLERRVRHAGVPIVEIPAKVFHENSSTLASGYAIANNRTYAANSFLNSNKIAKDDFTEGNWSLDVRRANRWD